MKIPHLQIKTYCINLDNKIFILTLDSIHVLPPCEQPRILIQDVVLSHLL